MQDPEVEFSHELEIFRKEAEAGVQFFYSWLTIQAVAGDHENVHSALNQAALFWNTSLGALQTAAFIALGRVFDQESDTHGIDQLLQIGQSNIGIFSKASLAARKRRESQNADDWLDEYLLNAYVPTANDFRELRKLVAEHRRIYLKVYRPIRHKIFAHKERLNREDIDALFRNTNITELQMLFIFLLQLHEALWQLFYNGRKPALQPMRYSVQEIRSDRRADQGHQSIQERLVYETEKFLHSIANEPR